MQVFNHQFSYLDRIVGQTHFKKEIEFLLNSFWRTDYLPHLCFISPRGCGKTVIARQVAAELSVMTEQKHKKKKGLIEINSSEIQDCDTFFTKLFPLISRDKHITLFFDECHQMGPSFVNSLLTILNPTDSHKTQYFLPSGERFEFDFEQLTVLMATTSPNLVHPDLMDRMRRMELDDYERGELAEIIVRKSGVSFNDGVLEEIASVVRGNARKATQLADDIKGMNCYRFGKKEWSDMRAALNIHPLGVSKIEVRYLKELQKGSCTLTEVSSRLGLSAGAVQKDVEIYLRRIGAFKTQQALGRVITPVGMKILEEIQS